MTITKDQAQMVANLATACRPTGARQWNPADVMAEIEKLRDRSLATVVCAVIRAAADRDAKRPSVIGSGGSHWSDSQMPTTFVPQTLDRTGRCSVCSHSEEVCRMRWAGDHEFESVAIAAKRRAEADPAALQGAVEALKAGIEPLEIAATKTLAELEAERPEFAARLAALQAKHPVPPLQEPEESA